MPCLIWGLDPEKTYGLRYLSSVSSIRVKYHKIPLSFTYAPSYFSSSKGSQVLLIASRMKLSPFSKTLKLCCDQLMKFLLLTTLFGKKLTSHPLRRARASSRTLAWLVSYQVKLPKRDPSSVSIYRSNWEITIVTPLWCFSPWEQL